MPTHLSPCFRVINTNASQCRYDHPNCTIQHYSNPSSHYNIQFPPILLSPNNRIVQRINAHPLQLELQQVAHHLARSNAGSRPQSGEVEGAGKGIGVAEEQHGRDPAPSVLEGEARAVHLVLLDLAADKVVHGTGGVLLGLEGSGDVGELLAVQDVEVVVRGVAAGVALGADGGTYRG